MPIFDVDDPGDPRVALFRDLSDTELTRSAGLFVAEGRLVVARLLDSPTLTTRSVLVTRPALAALEPRLAARPELPVYAVTQAVMNTVTGFNIHRGCLALGERPASRPWRELHIGGEPRRLVVLENVGNADNVGSIFRSAAAFGAGAVLVSPGCADPLYRKAIRTSMAAALSIPFAVATPWPGVLDELGAAGIQTMAMTTAGAAPPLHAVAALIGGAPAAIVVGHEGDGLSAPALEKCAHRARIEITAAVDSLNVATAAAIALYALRSHR